MELIVKLFLSISYASILTDHFCFTKGIIIHNLSYYSYLVWLLRIHFNLMKLIRSANKFPEIHIPTDYKRTEKDNIDFKLHIIFLQIIIFQLQTKIYTSSICPRNCFIMYYFSCFYFCSMVKLFSILFGTRQTNWIGILSSEFLFLINFVKICTNWKL